MYLDAWNEDEAFGGFFLAGGELKTQFVVMNGRQRRRGKFTNKCRIQVIFRFCDYFSLVLCECHPLP